MQQMKSSTLLLIVEVKLTKSSRVDTADSQSILPRLSTLSLDFFNIAFVVFT